MGAAIMSSDERLEIGQAVKRTDTDRRGTVAANDSLFVTLVQWLNGEEAWCATSLLQRVKEKSA
jgi:hypothetical protein